jgi:hypothetical protein
VGSTRRKPAHDDDGWKREESTLRRANLVGARTRLSSADPRMETMCATISCIRCSKVWATVTFAGGVVSVTFTGNQRICTLTMDKGDFLDRTADEPAEGEPTSRAETKKGAEEKHGRKCPNACPVTDYRIWESSRGDLEIMYVQVQRFLAWETLAIITFLTGVIQGGTSSPRIFSIFVNALLELIGKGKTLGISHGIEETEQFDNVLKNSKCWGQ